MKSHRLTLSAAALLIVLTCSSAFAQDMPLPSTDGGAEATVKNPREGYVPLADGARQSRDSNAPVTSIEPASTAAWRTFTSGSGPTFFRYTVSIHGNVISLQSPAGFEHLNVGSVGEGYIVSMNTAIGIVRYYDAGYVEPGGCSGNLRSWSPNVFETGVNAGGTTLIRDTCDGAWRLTQTFLRNAVNHELTVTMKLQNISGFNYTSVRLDRYFDADLDGDVADDTFARTFDSVGGQDGLLDNLAMTAISFNISHNTAIHTFAGWNPTITNQASLASPTGVGDFVGRVSYNLGTINNNVAKTVKVLYKRQ